MEFLESLAVEVVAGYLTSCLWFTVFYGKFEAMVFFEMCFNESEAFLFIYLCFLILVRFRETIKVCNCKTHIYF